MHVIALGHSCILELCQCFVLNTGLGGSPGLTEVSVTSAVLRCSLTLYFTEPSASSACYDVINKMELIKSGPVSVL